MSWIRHERWAILGTCFILQDFFNCSLQLQSFPVTTDLTCGWESISRLQEQILPSVEMLIRLWAFCVPTTFTQYTGCCEYSEAEWIFCYYCLLKINRVNNPTPSSVRYRVCCRWQRGPLHGGPLITPVVPQNDLPWIRSSNHNVRVKLCKCRGQHGGLQERKNNKKGQTARYLMFVKWNI